MASRYSVIQYVPDPIADERINIGILAFDDDKVAVRFLNRWDRVRCFGMEDIHFLHEFMTKMQTVTSEGLLFPGDQDNGKPKQERLLKVSNQWMNSIQFTEPRGSLNAVENLLDDLAGQFLREPVIEQRRKLRDRQAAARVAQNWVRQVVKERCGEDLARELVQPKYAIKGKTKDHKFDITVGNGQPFFTAHGISFEVQTHESVMDSLAWMIYDVKQIQPNFPLAVLTLPPAEESFERHRLQSLYEKTVETYQELGASVMDETQISDWVTERLAIQQLSLK